jgi:WD40 repeat protein
MLRIPLLIAVLVLCATSHAAAGQTPSPLKDLHGDPLPPFAMARLGTVRWRHDDVIRFAAFLPDGKRVISVGADETIRVWEFPSGKELNRISLAAAPDAKVLLIAPSAFGGSSGFAAALSKDGKVVATYFQTNVFTQAKGGQIRLHEVDTGKELPALRTMSQDVSSLVFSPNGEHLISMHYSAPARLWDWAKGQELRRFDIPGNEENPGNSGLLLKGGFGGGPVPPGMRSPDGHDGVAYSPDGNTLMHLTPTNTLRFVDVRSGKEIGPTGHALAVQSVQFTPKGNEIVTKGSDGSMQRWEAASGRNLGSIKTVPVKGPADKFAPKLAVGTVAISPDGQILVQMSVAQAAGGRVFTLVDSGTGKELGEIQLDVAGPIQPFMLFSPGNKLLAIIIAGPKSKSIADQKILLYDAATGNRLHMLALDPSAGTPAKQVVGNIRNVLFSPDGQTLAWGIDQRSVSLWDTTTGKRTGSLPLPNGAANQQLAFTPDGRGLALDTNDGTVTLYELATAGPRRMFGQSSPKAATRIAATSASPLAPTRLQLDAGSRISVSPNGKSLALAATDRTIRVWDIATGNQLAAFKGHAATLNAVAFSPDSKWLASASADTTALLWDMTKLDRPVPIAKALQSGELEQCWQVLATNDGAKAFTAICDLTASPTEAVAWIKDKIKPAAAAEMKFIEDLIAQVDDDQFKVREKATSELYKIGEPIVPALEKALSGNLTLETKRRLEQIRDRLTTRVLQGDRLRNYRAVEVLEHIGTPQARQVLEELAAGAPGTLLTISAQAALKR